MRALIAAAMVLVLAGCSTEVTEYELPTIAQLSTYDDNTLSINVRVDHLENGCVVATIDDTRYFTIWPEGFTQDDLGNVLTVEHDMYGQGGMFIGTVILTDRATVVAASDSRMDSLITFCQGDDDNVAIILKLDA